MLILKCVVFVIFLFCLLVVKYNGVKTTNIRADLKRFEKQSFRLKTVKPLRNVQCPSVWSSHTQLHHSCPSVSVCVCVCVRVCVCERRIVFHILRKAQQFKSGSGGVNLWVGGVCYEP